MISARSRSPSLAAVFLQTPPPWAGWLGAGLLWRARDRRLTPSLTLEAEKTRETLEGPYFVLFPFFTLFPLWMYLFFFPFLLGFSLFVLLRVRRSLLAWGCGWRRADLLGDDRALWEHSRATAKDVSEEARVELSGDRITRTHSAGRSLIVDGRTGGFFSCGSKKLADFDGTKGVDVGAAQRSSLVQHQTMQARPPVGLVWSNECDA